MAGETVVFITGANRGIGNAIVKEYLLRPNHIVVGAVRDASVPKSQELKNLPTADNTRLLLVSIEGTSLIDPANAIEEIEGAGITHVDVVIANAAHFKFMMDMPDVVDIQNLMASFQVNTLSPILLYQAIKPLLDKSPKPIWMTVSSQSGSIGEMADRFSHTLTSYGISRAAVNFFTAAIHVSNPSCIAFAIHPGHVQSETGNAGARMMGLEQAPITLDECSFKTIACIDNATRETTSGRYISVVEGTEIGW